MTDTDLNSIIGYLGTYASSDSEGIYRFTIEKKTGALSRPELFYKAPDCKYLSLYGSFLAAPIRDVQDDTRAGVCLLDISNGKARLIDTVFEENTTACFVAQDEEFVYTANYHQGLVLIYRKSLEGLTVYKRIEIGSGAGCHQVLFHGHYILVPCLLLDEIRIFDSSRGYSPAGVIRYKQGTGPRHGIFTRNHRFFFVVSELSNELFMYRVEDTDNLADSQNGGTVCLKLLDVKSLLPPKQTQNDDNSPAPATAAIRLSPDESYLYVSTRFADIISVFAISREGMDLVQQTGSGGVHPRDFMITGDGRYLLSVNRTEGGLVCFPVHAEDGTLGTVCSQVPAPETVSIVLEPESKLPGNKLSENKLQGNKLQENKLPGNKEFEKENKKYGRDI